jgi:hypothetical protein
MQQITFADDTNDPSLIVHDRNGADVSLDEQLGNLFHRSRGPYGNDRRNHHIGCHHGSLHCWMPCSTSQRFKTLISINEIDCDLGDERRVASSE